MSVVRGDASLRQMVVRIDAQQIIDEQKAKRALKNAIPEDARVTMVQREWPNTVAITLASPSFDLVPPGTTTPELQPVYSTKDEAA